MFRIKGYEQIIESHFDITHNETRKILLAINEVDQNVVLTALTSKLYDHIVNKVDDIDYGDIPDTKGDITKLGNYDKLTDCVDIIKSILVEYKQDTRSIDVVSKAIDNVIARKELFEKGFRYNVEFVIVTYSTIVLSIISSVSFLISTCIEFIKLPTNEDFELTLDKVALNKTKQNLLFTNLDKFNNSCAKGEIDNALEFIIKNGAKNFTGAEIGMVAGGLALVGIILNILPILRELVFFFYYSRTRVSDYFDIQADLLQMNAYNLQNSKVKTAEERKRIVAKQMKIVDLFRNLSNKLAISNKESEVKATKEIINTNKQYKTDEVLDSVPDSATSALF